MITLRLCEIFWVTLKWRKDINISHYKSPKKFLFVPVNFSERIMIMFQWKYWIFLFFDFNWFRMNKDMPLYHIPCIISVYFILYHTLNYTFLKNLRNFYSTPRFFLLFGSYLLFKTMTSRRNYTIFLEYFCQTMQNCFHIQK